MKALPTPRQHHHLDLRQGDPVVIDILAESSEERGDRIGRLDEHRRLDALVFHSDNLGCASTYVNTYYYAHIFMI